LQKIKSYFKMGKGKKIKDLEDNLSNSFDEVTLMPEGIVSSYGERSCADLFRMYKTNQLQIQPDFQRNEVWKPPVQTKFIDSLIKKLPIPSVFIGLDITTEKHIVIDGLQRISTIIRFFEDERWRLSKLPDIDERISGKSVSKIKQQSPEVFRIVENVSIPVTIVRGDLSNPNNNDYLFSIFNRLNTGGQKLNNQEIRNCIYSSNFNKLLRKIAQSEQWINSMGKAPKIDRLDREELILRTFAFIDKLDDYDGNLARFLNLYMAEKKNISDNEVETKYTTLISALTLIHEKIDNPDTVHKFGKTLKEALLVGVAKNISTLLSKSKEDIQSMFEDFVHDDEFSEDNLSQALSSKPKVQSRLRKSISIFGGEC